MEELAIVWKRMVGPGESWAVFTHGTCVILAQPEDDLAQQARTLLAQWGPVAPGTSAGDFTVVPLDEPAGWIVLCHNPDVLNYVGPDEVEAGASHVRIGLLGRSKRDRDGRDPAVAYIEDGRAVDPEKGPSPGDP